MTQPSFTEQVAALNRMLGDIEARVAHGAVPDQSLAEFKGAVDELRLRHDELAPLAAAAADLARAAADVRPGLG